MEIRAVLENRTEASLRSCTYVRSQTSHNRQSTTPLTAQISTPVRRGARVSTELESLARQTHLGHGQIVELGSGCLRLEPPKWCQTPSVNNLMNVRIDVRDELGFMYLLAPEKTHGSRATGFRFQTCHRVLAS